MNQLAKIDPYDPPDEAGQQAYILAILQGKPPAEAARLAGCSQIGVWLARHASPEFNDACHLADAAKRENVLHEVVQKAMVATGSVHLVQARCPDTDEPLMDDNFEPVMVPRLLNGNAAILSKLLDKLVVAADRPQAPVQVNVAQTNHNQSDGEVVLIDPTAEMADE